MKIIILTPPSLSPFAWTPIDHNTVLGTWNALACNSEQWNINFIFSCFFIAWTNPNFCHLALGRRSTVPLLYHRPLSFSIGRVFEVEYLPMCSENFPQNKKNSAFSDKSPAVKKFLSVNRCVCRSERVGEPLIEKHQTLQFKDHKIAQPGPNRCKACLNYVESFQRARVLVLQTAFLLLYPQQTQR
jgi:hypothetical protein